VRVEVVHRLSSCFVCGYESSDHLRVRFNGKSLVFCPRCLRELGDLIDRFFQDNWYRYEKGSVIRYLKNHKRRN